MRTSTALSCSLLTAALALAADPAAAGSLSPPGTPAPTMRSLSDISPGVTISSLPFTITSPGTYSLSQNLVCPQGSSAITVSSSNVTIDLNGFSIRGTPGGGGSGVLVDGPRQRVTVRNGSLTNFDDDGVSAPDARQCVVEDLSVASCGSSGVEISSGSLSSVRTSSCGTGVSCPSDLADGTDVTLEDVVVSSSSSAGITIFGGCDVSMYRCDSSGNTGSGIDLSSSSSSQDFSLALSSVSCAENGGDGISVSSPSTNSGCKFKIEISGCTVSSNALDGLDDDCDGIGSSVAMQCVDSSFSSNGQCGISHLMTGDGSVLSMSLVRTVSNGCGTKGIKTGLSGSSSSMTVTCTDSSSSSNGSDGLYISSTGSGNTVCGETSHFRSLSNGGNGIWGDNDCDDADFTFRCLDTTSSSNSLDGFSSTCTGDSSRVSVSLERCVSSSNKGNGVSSSSDCDDLDFSMRCVEVSSSSNTTDGFSLSRTGPGSGLSSSVTCLFDRCSSSSNGGHGMDMDSDDDGLSMSVRCMDSSCSSNQLDGLHFSSTVVSSSSFEVAVEGSSLSSNGGSGMRVLGSGGGGSGGCNLYLSSSRCVSNGDDGVHVDFSPVTSFSVLLSMDDTDCDDSDDDGIYFRGSLSKKGYDYYQACSASRNSGDGVDADCDVFTAEMCSFDGNGLSGATVTSSSCAVSSSSFSSNAADGLYATCDSTFSSSECRMVSNGGSGGSVISAAVSSMSCVYSDNGFHGLHAVSSLGGGGVIHRDLAARNILSGIFVEGDNFDISECRSVGHNRASTATSAGIRVAGSGNQIHGNFVGGNDYGVHLVSGNNPLYENSGSSNTSPLFQEAAASSDSGPSSSAAAATSPTSNIGF